MNGPRRKKKQKLELQKLASKKKKKKKKRGPKFVQWDGENRFYDATINIVALRWKRESRERMKREEKADEIFSLAPGLQANREINWRIFFSES